MKKMLLGALVCMVYCIAFCQPASDSLNYPRIGRPCPDFTLRNIKYYSKRQATLNDFKGKWLLLSFWNKNCAGCIASFPAENRWFERYKDKMQFISVAIQDSEGKIEPMFERYKQKEGLQFPVSFDSLLAKRWDVYVGPDFLLIDPNGIVRARAEMNSNLLGAFLAGNSPKVLNYNQWNHYDFETDPRISFDEKKPYLVNGNGGRQDQFSYRSIISEFDCETQKQAAATEDSVFLSTGQFSIIGYPLWALYNYAFYGSIHPPKSTDINKDFVVEAKDSVLLRYSTNCENLFCYNLNLPVSMISKERVMKCMQKDLENYFGMKASLVIRRFPAWKLVLDDNRKWLNLKTKGGQRTINGTSKTEDFFARNIPWNIFLNKIKGEGFYDLVDKTNMDTYNIDIDLHCSFQVKNEIIKALHDNGLDLLPTEVNKMVLVISDAN